MVPLHMAGFPGKHEGSLSNFTAPILTAAKDVIYPVLITANAEVPTVFILVNILPIFPAFPNHAWINIGDSLHSTNSNVLSRQQTCHQRNPKHYILRIWNCYIVTDYVWSQVNVFFFAVILESRTRAREVKTTGTDYCYDNEKKCTFGLKPGFHIVVSVVSVVSVVRKKFIGEIQLYGNLPYNCSIQ